MEYAIICSTALVVAALTLFSGFGLGTLLMPAFAIFFPVEMAVAATAVVHLANNVFKAALVGRKANASAVVLFALPAAAFAALGAWLLGSMSQSEPLLSYHLGSRLCRVTTVKLVISSLILLFAVLEVAPKSDRFLFSKKYIPLGGALSGFFGGLSGHQGALRTAFLTRLGLSKEAFIGTIVMSAVIVDVSRITVYGLTFVSKDISVLEMEGAAGLVVAGIAAAFAGSFIGARLVKRITMRTIQLVVGSMLLLMALALGSGVI
jgi:uncharacterized membrane protein YfcA